jgi:hypothetical protein
MRAHVCKFSTLITATPYVFYTNIEYMLDFCKNFTYSYKFHVQKFIKQQ